MKRPLAMECRLALVFGLIWAIGVARGLPVNMPDLSSLYFLNVHYFGPLLGAIFLQIPLTMPTFRAEKRDRWLMLKLLPFLVLVVFVHFNFKAWMPLVNPLLYDEVFHSIDQFAWPVVQLFYSVREGLALLAPFSVDNLYHYLFVGVFFVSLGLHSLFDHHHRQRQMVTGMSLILLLGGMLYWVMPALGPFCYHEGLNAHSTAAQMHMFRLTSVVYLEGRLPEGYFLAPLAAMPSLHIAHTLFFTMFAYRSLRWLFWGYVPVLFWMVIESVASGFHYLVDLPVGACLAVFCYYACQYLLPVKKLD